MKPVLVGAVVLAACMSTRADPVDVYVEARLKSLHIPGASLAIVRDGRIVKARGYGLASLELGAAATEHTVYEIGSVTKQFTAAAVMMLVDEGKVGLDDPITAYFPDAPPAWARITVRHLLTHTSGIQNHVAVPDWMKVFKTDLFYDTTPGRAELLERFYRLPLEFEPGQTWAYDNTGYILLGFLIEKASGRSYWDFLSERIFNRAKMAETRSTAEEPIVANRAAGYEWVDGAFHNRPSLPPTVAFSAGSVLSTVGDLAKWDRALYGDELLPRAARDRSWTPARTRDGADAPFDYGFGWFIDRYHGHRFVQHSGGTPGFSSAIYRFLDDRLSVILLANHSDRILDSIVLDVAGLVEPALRRSVAKVDPDPRRTGRVQAALAGLLAGKRDAEAFTPPMRLFLDTATGAALWKWVASEGELQAVSYADEETVPGGRLVRYQIVFGGHPFWFSVKLADDGRIAQIRWW